MSSGHDIEIFPIKSHEAQEALTTVIFQYQIAENNLNPTYNLIQSVQCGNADMWFLNEVLWKIDR